MSHAVCGKQRKPVELQGARHGVRGIVNEDFVDLTRETSHNLEMVAATPGSALGSTRDKPDLKYCHQIFEVLRAHGIGHFFYIGGNDSADRNCNCNGGGGNDNDCNGAGDGGYHHHSARRPHRVGGFGLAMHVIFGTTAAGRSTPR